MADSSDVEQALVGLLAGVVYPSGTSAPSIVNAEVQFYRGWPEVQQLNAQMAAGKAVVSVFAQSRGVRNVTRYPQAWQSLSQQADTLLATVSGMTVTFSGTCAVGLNAGVAVQGFGYVYAVQASDTPTTVATALAALIPGASSSDTVLTCPALPSVVVGTTGTAIRELRRQQQLFVVTTWCSSPAQRDALAAALDLMMAQTSFLALPDWQQAQVVFQDTVSADSSENANLYRRDLTYRIEYATTQMQGAPTLVFLGGPLGPSGFNLGIVPPATQLETDGNGDIAVAPSGQLIGA